MSRKMVFWAVCLFLICLFFYSVRGILLPFVVGMLVAYLLDPVVDAMQKWRISRGIAVLLVILSFFVSITLVSMLVIPVLSEQISGFFRQLPKYIERFHEEVVPFVKQLAEQVEPHVVDRFQSGIAGLIKDAGEFAGELTRELLQSGLWFVNLLSLLVVTPVVAFYLLRDWDHLVEKLDTLMPRDSAPVIRQLVRQIDAILSGFIRGQLNVCLLLGLFYGTALTVAGLNYGFTIGITTGLLSFIPYFGMFVGAGLGLVIAFFQYGSDWVSIGMVAAIFAIGQIIEGNFVTPKLVGDRVRLHPAWLIFGMLAGGSLIGVVGVLIAVPVTAMVGVLVRFALEQYRDSEFYAQVDSEGEDNALPKTEDSREFP